MAIHDARRRERGSALPLVLGILALLAGAGTWNYHRNWQAERAEPRPYAGYDDAELAALVDAYAAEREAAASRAAAAPRADVRTPDGALLDERVAAFERARRAGEAQRRHLGEARVSAGVLEGLRREQRLRAERGGGLALHWRRLTGW